MTRLLAVALTHLAVAAVSCTTSQHSVVGGDDTLGPADCGSADVQRVITYCASPQAADLALRNADLMGDAGSGDVPYSPLPIGDSPVLGPEDAPVTVVMFTDLECPYCRELHQTLVELQEEQPDEMRLVFKHTPLAFHPNAVPAALGALAAREQGEFWNYVDRVFANQEGLGDEALMGHAHALGLDLEKFKNDYGTDSHVTSIEQDLALAGQAGVRGTPTIFVNGIRVVGVYPKEDLAALVENQKMLVKRLRAAGVDAADLYWRMVAVQYDEQGALAQRPTAEPAEERPVVEHVPTDGAPARGAAVDDAHVTIVEFSDFQCPYCAGATSTIDAVLGDHDDVRLVYRHFPLPNHPDAKPAAIASLVAAEEGKFWEYHDLLFSRQEDLSADALAAYAKEVGIDPAPLKEALGSEEYADRVEADMALAREHGVQGTPTLFVNGVMVLGIASPDEFRALVEEQQKLGANVAQETGLTGDELYVELVKRNREAAGE